MRFASLLLLAALPAGLAVAGITLVSLEPLGGPGGAPYVARCSQNELLGGLELRVGDDVDAVRAICVDADGGNRRSHQFAFGGSGGKPMQLLCPDDNPIVTGLFVRWEGVATRVVNNIHLQCGQVSTTQAEDVSGQSFNGARVVYPFGSGLKKSSSEGQGTQRCTAGYVAVGIHGRSGIWLDALGLVCGLQKPALPPVPLGRKQVIPGTAAPELLEKKRSIPIPEREPDFADKKRNTPVPNVELSTDALRTPSEPPICASARNARARNSPAAAALELQCRVAGGMP